MGKTALEIIAANYERRSEIRAEMRDIDEAATADKRGYNDDETERRSALLAEAEQIDDRIQANLKEEIRSQEIDSGLQGLLGVMADKDTGKVVDTRSVGARFAEDPEYRAWAEAGAKGRSPIVDFDGVDFRAVTDVTTGATSGGALIETQRLARVGQDFLDRRVYLIDQLPRIPISGPVEYVQDQSPLADMANKAVEVAEGQAKPQAGPTLAVISENAAVIAAWANITRQTAADAPQVMGYLDGRLRYSLKRRADGQVINGDGNSPNLSGLLDRSGILTEAPGGSEERYVTIRKGITTMEENETVPEIVVLNPADAEIFDLSNHSDDGLHAVPNVAGPGARTSWGLTQVRSNAVASGTAILIDPMSVAVLDRQQPTAHITDSHASNFTSNILTLLLELRLGLAVFEPKGILKITFNGTV
jgi:HK97 family phage major capsid protein